MQLCQLIMHFELTTVGMARQFEGEPLIDTMLMSVGRMSFKCQKCCCICIQQQNSNSQKKDTTSHICIYTQTASGEICATSCNWWSSKQNGQLLLSILSTGPADPGPLLGTLLWPVWTWLVMLIHITRWIHNSFVFTGILHTLFFYPIYCFAHMKKAISGFCKSMNSVLCCSYYI